MEINPGVKLHLEIGFATQEEQRILQKFGKVFQIGFFREDLFKQVFNRYFFAKPTDYIKLKFNLDNEVLVLFNDMSVFETRTLDIVDKLTTIDFRNRLDKVCTVIISKDKSFVSKVELLNAKQESSRIIVPFTYSELLEAHNDIQFIENRFIRFFYAKDLFDLDSPIRTDNFFFGRNHVVQQFLDKYSHSENSALFGLRKIGKTSVLYAVRRICEQREIPVIYIDCQSPSFHQRKWFEALQYIIKQAALQFPKIKSDWLIEEEYKEKDAALLFEKDLKKLQTMMGHRRLLIIFDEIENLTFNISPSEHWRTGQDFLLFWQTIRSIFQSDRDSFCFILAGVNPTIIEKTVIGDFDNPVFNIASPNFLELFNLEIIKEMVSTIGNYMGLKFEDEVYFLLHEDFGGHPFLTRIACSSINKLIGLDRPKTVTKFWYKQNRDKFASKVLNYVEQLLLVLKQFYPQEYYLLEVLASGDRRKFEEIIGSIPSSGKHLEGYGIVNTKNNEYYFRLKIVEDYIKERTDLAKIFNSKEEKIAEISKRRNSLEDKLKKLARIILHAAYGANAKVKILQAIPSERRDKIEPLSLEEIFIDHIYFLDIMQIYVKEFKYFENVFEKQSSKLYQSLDHINKFRIDAHAKDISDDDLQMLVIEFNWLEKCINKMNL
jgi:hypothetical protein